MIYTYCDNVLKDMNRRNLRAFDKLKLLKFDELNILRTVTKTYDDSVAMAKKRYQMIYIDAFQAAAEELKSKKKSPDDDILNDWLLDMLEDYDALTHYRFNEEMERKKARTAEALIASKVDSREVERALRLLTLQLVTYADRAVLDGRMQAFKEAGVKKVQRHEMNDERTCNECRSLDGEIYDIDKVPPRSHYRCRAWYTAYFGK